MSKQKETAATANSDGNEFRHFIVITDDEAQLQAFADLYRMGITKEQIEIILSTVRLNVGISAQPSLDTLFKGLQYIVSDWLAFNQVSYEASDKLMEMLFDNWKNHQAMRQMFSESLRKPKQE